MNNVNTISLHCHNGHCPSGPTAGQQTQQWILADGRLVQSITHPADRYGSIAHVELDYFGRDGYTHDSFGSHAARGVSADEARKYLADNGAVEVPDWTRTFLYAEKNHGGWWSWDNDGLRAWIGAWYDLHGLDIGVPVPKSDTEMARDATTEWFAAHEQAQRAKFERVFPQSKRIVSGTRRRRNARRRVNR